MILWLAGCTPDPYPAVALAHAPVHFQDTDASAPMNDELAAIDYDGNWVTTDNWDNLDHPETWTTGTHAVVYRSVVDTCTHWFVTYAFYHPRDWTDTVFDQEHENDLEGLVLAVRKDGSPTGAVEAAITAYHNDFFSYVPAGSPWSSGYESIDGVLSFQDVDGAPHPVTAQQAKGHGLKAWPYAGDFTDADDPDQDGIVYLPSDVSEDPPSGTARDVGYTLENLFDELWVFQLLQTDPFATWGHLAGDESGGCGPASQTCSEDAANPPWMWDDSDDVYSLVDGQLVSTMPPGLPALDPARLFDAYFDDVGAFSLDYAHNGYAEGLRDAAYDDASPPAGFPSGLSLDALYGHLGATCGG